MFGGREMMMTTEDLEAMAREVLEVQCMRDVGGHRFVRSPAVSVAWKPSHRDRYDTAVFSVSEMLQPFPRIVRMMLEQAVRMMLGRPTPEGWYYMMYHTMDKERFAERVRDAFMVENGLQGLILSDRVYGMLRDRGFTAQDLGRVYFANSSAYGAKSRGYRSVRMAVLSPQDALYPDRSIDVLDRCIRQALGEPIRFPEGKVVM